MTTPNGLKIAAAIPAYDAATTVGAVVRETLREIADVLVVDDGSTDGTFDAARAAGARVLRHAKNLGKGSALRTAFFDLFGSGYEAVLTLDADGQHLPEEIPRLCAGLTPEADLVLGSRQSLFAGMCLQRRLANRASARMISLAAGCRIGDAQTGFRIYRRRLVEATGFPEPRFEAESAVVVRAARLGFKIVGVPIRLGFVDGRKTSHYRPIVDSVRIALAVARIWGQTLSTHTSQWKGSDPKS